MEEWPADLGDRMDNIFLSSPLRIDRFVLLINELCLVLEAYIFLGRVLSFALLTSRFACLLIQTFAFSAKKIHLDINTMPAKHVSFCRSPTSISDNPRSVDFTIPGSLRGR